MYGKFYKVFTQVLFASFSVCFSFAGDILLEPMEVSALRLETSSQNLPARIQVIDQAEIEQSGAMDIVDCCVRKQTCRFDLLLEIQQRLYFSGGFGDTGDTGSCFIGWT